MVAGLICESLKWGFFSIYFSFFECPLLSVPKLSPPGRSLSLAVAFKIAAVSDATNE